MYNVQTKKLQIHTWLNEWVRKEHTEEKSKLQRKFKIQGGRIYFR